MERDDAESLVRQLLSLNGLTRRFGSSVDEIVASLQGPVSQAASAGGIELTDWSGIAANLSRLLKSKAVRNAAMAVELSYDYANLLRNVRILSDIRPLYDEEADHIEGALISHTMRVHYDSADGEHDLSLALDEKDIQQLLDQCIRALKKSQTAKASIQFPSIISGQIGGVTMINLQAYFAPAEDSGCGLLRGTLDGKAIYREQFLFVKENQLGLNSLRIRFPRQLGARIHRATVSEFSTSTAQPEQSGKTPKSTIKSTACRTYIKARLKGLSLPGSWKDEGVPVATEACLAEAERTMLRLFAKFGIVPYKFALSREGGVFAAYRSSNNNVLRLDVDNELDAVAVVSDGTHVLGSALLGEDSSELSLFRMFNDGVLTYAISFRLCYSP